MKYKKDWTIDLHIHSTISDGTDSPIEICTKAKEKKLSIISITDHDDIVDSSLIQKYLGSVHFIQGIEFSCQDDFGKSHILGYDYQREHPSIVNLVRELKELRQDKLAFRLRKLNEKYGIEFKEKDIQSLHSLNNPGKPHLATLFVQYGIVKSKEEAFVRILNSIHYPQKSISSKKAIRAILDSGGLPILAHPIFGSGDQRIIGKELENRIEKLLSFGLMGIEGYYSSYTSNQQEECLLLASRYNLLVSAGSDYHGKNKKVSLGQTHLDNIGQAHPGLHQFLDRIQNNL